MKKQLQKGIERRLKEYRTTFGIAHYNKMRGLMLRGFSFDEAHNISMEMNDG